MNIEPFRDIKARPTVDYVLRTTQQNHVQLSVMADQKANILIGASFLMLTLLVGQLRSNGMIPELLVLGATTLAAAVFAILAVMPSARRSPTSDDPMNPLFFATIASLSELEFDRRLADVIRDDASAYAAVAHDLYQHASVLAHRKYRWLRASYGVFVAGWLITAAVSVLRHLFAT